MKTRARAILLAAALYTRRSAKNFRMVVQTAGDDIGHLMQALTALRNAYPTPEERRRLAEIAKQQAGSDEVRPADLAGG